MWLSVFYKRRIRYFGLLLIFSQCLFASQEKYLHFTEIDGLPRNIINCLEQDKYGYLWIGTTNGIVRYDGNNFYPYEELTGLGVIYLLYDTNNNLWVATDIGLFKYNPLTNYFEPVVNGYITKIQEDNGDIYYLWNSNIYRIDGNNIVEVYNGNNLTDFCFSKEGIWFGQNNDGVKLLSRESGFSDITASYLKSKYASYISKIDNKLFVGCYNGELYSVLDNKKAVQIDIENHYFVRKVQKVGQEFWFATDGNGIIILDKNLKYSRTLNRNTNKDVSINSNSIYDIYPGKSNEIWLASYGAGLTCILPDNLLFQNILPEKGNKNSLIANEGASVYINEPYFYFGTNYGLSTWNQNTGQFNNLSSDKLRKELKGTKVTAIHLDKTNNLWVGTYDGLLGRYNTDYQLIKTYHPSSSTPEEMQQIVFLHELDNDHMLILTQFYNLILLNFNINTERAEPFELNFKGSNITYFLLNSIRQNQQGELLALLSDKGLYHVNWEDNVLENRLVVMNEKIDCYISDFYHDKKGNYWFASSTDGLLRVSDDGRNYDKWTVKEGLPSNTLLRIESVDDHFLWISTISGICRFDMESEQMLNFNYSDGLPANEFLDRSSGKTKDGKIIFGSLAGFTVIDPSKVAPDTNIAQVIISDISFQGQSIRNPNGKLYLKKPLEETEEIWLPYNKNSFNIHFFTKTKSYLRNHNYGYRLIGLEKQTNYTAEANYATYTNLSPGAYTFEITCTDKSLIGIPTKLIIHIRSPWYLSWYAIIAYVIIFFIIVYLSVYAYIKRMQLRKEKEMSVFEIQKEHELTEKKLAFFTSISHDLKTPLTLIDAPVNDLLHDPSLNQEQKNKLMIVNRNSKRLYKLITDLLDFRKVTQKQYVLKVRETVVSNIIVDVYQAFIEECKNKSVNFKYSVKEDVISFVDAEKIEKILWNLISNAIKFSPKGGNILVSAEEIIKEGNKHLKLVVSDQGIGISEDNKNKIFDRFFKIENTRMKNKEGTGVGLSIVKDLIDLHHGSIHVESTLGSGTTFTVMIPAGDDFYAENEIEAIDIAEQEKTEYAKLEIPVIEFQNDSKQKQYNIPGILIVEDNSELREYLAGHFKKKYKVYQAEDGYLGLKMAKENNPDIILTDVEMPNMNGYDFCNEIRLQFDTSHIPVVMLTANDSVGQQIEGLSTGADVYLTKPFEIKILDAQVNSLLENRKALRRKFTGIETPENLEKNLPQKDIEFILELKLFIEENVMLQDLSVKSISEHFAVSLAQLHRKIKALTGSTPNNLIKTIRLKRAYKLIKEEGLRVSEAAYRTGFSDPNYFTSCFKKEFGENPSQIGTGKDK